MASTLSQLKKNSEAKSAAEMARKAKKFSQLWDSASDADRNAFRNWQTKRLTNERKRAASRKKTSGGSGG